MRAYEILALLVALTALAPAQEFEVASVRPAVDDGNHDSDVDRGRYLVHNLTLKRLIAAAWDIEDGAVLGGLGWTDADGWDINAKIPDEFAQRRTPEQFRQMIRELLASRFHLTVHRESLQISGYALVVAKGGSKLLPAKPDENGSVFNNNKTHLKAANVTMDGFARRLSRDRDVAKVVVDRTGLTGKFDFELSWARADDSADDRPPLFTAIQNQLGLRLESAKVPIEAVVIDRAEKPEAN